MYAFKKIMIALDLSEMDKYILNYVDGLCKLIQPEKVYFLNIQKNFDLNAEEKSLMGIDDKKPVDEFVHKRLETEINDYFASSSNYKTEIEIVEGNASEELLRWTKIKKVDLLVMGRKMKLSGQGIAPQQIAPKVNSSILLVPEGVSEFKVSNVFIPVNFTNETVLALEEALYIQDKTAQNVDINCHYVFELPLGHEKSGKSDEEFAEILERNASKKFKKMKLDIGSKASQLDYSTEMLKDGNIAKALNVKAKEYNTDLIIMGAKCKTLAAQLFLGNTTKKMIINDSTIPLLVVKDKKSTFDFWDFFSKQ